MAPSVSQLGWMERSSVEIGMDNSWSRDFFLFYIKVVDNFSVFLYIKVVDSIVRDSSGIYTLQKIMLDLEATYGFQLRGCIASKHCGCPNNTLPRLKPHCIKYMHGNSTS